MENKGSEIQKLGETGKKERKQTKTGSGNQHTTHEDISYKIKQEVTELKAKP